MWIVKWRRVNVHFYSTVRECVGVSGAQRARRAVDKWIESYRWARYVDLYFHLHRVNFHLSRHTRKQVYQYQLLWNTVHVMTAALAGHLFSRQVKTLSHGTFTWTMLICVNSINNYQSSMLWVSNFTLPLPLPLCQSMNWIEWKEHTASRPLHLSINLLPSSSSSSSSPLAFSCVMQSDCWWSINSRYQHHSMSTAHTVKVLFLSSN